MATTTSIPAPVTGAATEPASTLTIPAQTITVAGQSVVIPAQVVALAPRTEAVTGTAAVPVSTDLTALAAALAPMVAALMKPAPGVAGPTGPVGPTGPAGASSGAAAPPAGKAITIVPLSGGNVVAIGSPAVAVTGGGIDGSGNVYSVAYLGTSLTPAGAQAAALTTGTFVFGASGALNGAANVTLSLPQANFSSLKLLATGVNGNQPAQVFNVIYTDGTTSAVTQSLSDWFSPQKYAGESIVASTDARLIASGATGTGPAMLYGYSLPLNPAKTAKSLALPPSRNVVVLALLAVP